MEQVSKSIDAALHAAHRHGRGVVRIYLSADRLALLMRNTVSHGGSLMTYRGVPITITMVDQADRVITSDGDAIVIEKVSER